MNLTSISPRSDLFFARAYYFTFLGGWGFILPFINLFFIEIGLSGKQIGLMGSVTAILGLIVSPLWMEGVRKSAYPRRLLQASLVLAAATYVLLGWQSAFLPILVIAFLQTLVMSGIMPTSDTLAVSTAQAANTGYGSVRLWASISWIVSVLAAGWLIERFGFQAGFYGTGLAFSLGAALIAFISPGHFSVHPAADNAPRQGLLSTLGNLCASPTLLSLTIAVCTITFFNMGVQQFENVYLAQLGASTTLISVAGILSAVVEIPVMIFIDRALRRSEPVNLLLLSFGATIFFRLLVLAIPSVAAIMSVRLIGGLSVAAYSVSFIACVTTNTDPAERGTILAIITSTLAGIVSIAATPVAGAIFDSLGAGPLYLMSAIGYIIAFVVLAMLNKKSLLLEQT